jgi:FtsP/CotA-like multicopper oxidase with cupredoxin domain
VLLRLANLGYQNHTVTVDGIDLLVVGKDAALLRGRDGSAEYQVTNTVQIGPGESRDVLFTAPDPGTYLLYDRDLMSLANAGGGRGGQLTEIRVSPPGTLPAQTRANA